MTTIPKRGFPPSKRNTKGSRLIGYIIDKYYSNPDPHELLDEPDPIKRAWKKNSQMLWEIETMSDEMFNDIVEDKLMRN